MAWTGVITNAGSGLLDRWPEGTPLHIDSAAAGTGRASPQALLAQTNVSGQRQPASIISGAKLENGYKIKVQIAATPEKTGYNLTQIGLWARAGDEEKPVLLALFQSDKDIPIPSQEEMPDYIYTFYGLLAISNNGRLVLHVDVSAAATLETLRDAVEAHDTSSEAHKDIRDAVAAAASSVKEKTITIPAEGWQDVGGVFPYQLDLACDGAEEKQMPMVDLDDASYDIAAACGLEPSVEAAEGILRFRAMARLESDMTATVALVAYGDSGMPEGGGGGDVGYEYPLPVASATQLGGVMIGENVDVTTSGKISVDPEKVIGGATAPEEDFNEMLDRIYPEDI